MAADFDQVILATEMPMSQFTVHEAKTNLSRLISCALKGEEIIIAKGKTPVVRLIPVEPKGKREFGTLKGKIRSDDRFHDPLPENEIEGWNL